MQDSPSSQQGYGFHIGSFDRGQQVPILPLRVHVDKRRTSQWRLSGPLNQYRRGVHPSRRRDRFPKAMADNIGRRTQMPRTSLRFGISSPEQFALVEPALAQLEQDLSPIQNLSATPNRERGDLQSAFEDPENPVTWAIPTGEPVIRFVAADSMQDDLQDTLLLGLVFCITALWWGFREDSPVSTRVRDLRRQPLQVLPRIVINMALMSVISYFLAGVNYAIIFSVLAIFFSILWGTRPLMLATITTAPIFLMIVWLYAIVGIAGYGLSLIHI